VYKPTAYIKYKKSPTGSKDIFLTSFAPVVKHCIANAHNISSVLSAYITRMKPMNLSQKISSLAERDFTALDENLTIDVGAKIMRGKGSTCIIVINYRSGKPTGIITERDILYRIVAENRAPSKTELKKLVSSPLITIDEESSERCYIVDDEKGNQKASGNAWR
jgi:CBS domain